MLHHMIHQPLINIGTLGSVSDGKSTLIAKCTGTHTQRHSNEKHRNITIRQGYANMKIWKENIENIKNHDFVFLKNQYLKTLLEKIKNNKFNIEHQDFEENNIIHLIIKKLKVLLRN